MTEEMTAPQEVTSEPAEVGTAPQQTNSFVIPEQYQGKGWTDKIKSSDDLFKAYDNAQQLIGKRPAGIPTQDASDDEWNQFYKAMGRPDEAKYEFPEIEGVPESFDIASYKDKAAQMMHEAGLSPKQANKLYQAFMAGEVESVAQQQAQHAEQQKAFDAQFDSLAKEHFGDEVEKYAELTKSEFDKFVPQSLKESFSKLQDMPDVLTALMAYTKGKQSEIERIQKAYTGEGSVVTGSQSKGQSIDDVRQELKVLGTSRAAADFTHPDYKKTAERIAELRSAMSRHFSTT